MKSNTLASSAIALGLFAVAGSQVYSTLADQQSTPGVDVRPVASVEQVANQRGLDEPFIVWYGSQTLSSFNGSSGKTNNFVLLRAWSDGVVEARSYDTTRVFAWFAGGCDFVSAPDCVSPWIVVSHPNEGRAAMSDANADGQVDLQDLNLLLANFGPAPRNDIPPSPCPFGLIPG